VGYGGFTGEVKMCGNAWFGVESGAVRGSEAGLRVIGRFESGFVGWLEAVLFSI